MGCGCVIFEKVGGDFIELKKVGGGCLKLR